MKKNSRGDRARNLSRSRRIACSIVGPVERLERRMMMAANPIISEFEASNSTTLPDGNGNYGDWIEIENTGDASIDMVGYHLTDDSTNPSKWTFPDTTIAAGGYLVVFADGANDVDPAGYLHTNFSLSSSGETLELLTPSLTIASSWNPDGTSYPAQTTDVSYGTGTIYHNTTLIAPGAAASVFVPTNSSLDANQWTAVSYNASSWTAGTTGIGYDTGGYEDNSVSPTMTGDWVADDLAANLSNGSKVATWSDEVAKSQAKQTTTSKEPTFTTNDFNGHAGVRFSASSSTQLRVPASSNPMSGAGDFTVAVVFKATTGIASKSEWYNNAGLVDGEETGTEDDWGLAVSLGSSKSYVGAGIGNPDTTVYGATQVNDSKTHVAVYTRSGGTFTLYVDGGNGITGSCSTADRDIEDMVFGSLQTNLNYFTGDIAEVQVYDGAETSAAKAYSVASPLAAKYGATLTAVTASTIPTLTGDWIGDSLAAQGNNSTVTSWTSTANSSSISATASSASIAPSVMTNQLNGHAVVHFNGSSSDQLRVTSSVNPMAGAGNFTVAVVFRTSTPGVGTGSNWFNNTGIVDAEQGGVTNDWGLAMNSAGQVGAGLGNPDETVYSGGLLDDGNAHVAVYTRSGDLTDIYIDGSTTPFESSSGGTANRNVADMVFGSIQTNLDYFTGDIAEVQTYNGALTGAQASSLGHTLNAKYGVISAPSVYAPYINTNIQTAMYGIATTADIRIPFTVPGAVSQYSRLQLTMQYDDGFVAYINGTEVLRENAPTGTITYQSVAPSVHPQSLSIVPQTIDLSAYLSLLIGNGATNVLSIKALNTSLTDPDLLILPQLTISTATVGPAYFTTPTPGAPNGAGYIGFVANPTISQPHGYYSSTFTTTIADTTPGATIYYTTDGSDPSPTNGTAIAPSSASATASGVVSISASTPLRAGAFLDAYIPSVITTVSYLFTSSVLTQTNTAPSGAYWSSAVNPAIVNLAQTYNVSQALLSIPSVSLVLPFNDMFGPLGIYTNPTEEGMDWEKETSFEYFDPNDTSVGFQINAGVRIQGGNDRQGGASDPKKSFRLFFRSQYGASQLEYPLFGTDDPQQAFDHVLLKAIHNYSWANSGGTDPTQGDLVRDAFARDLQQQITGHSARDKWVQLYIDGQYWGLYDMTEEPDSTWAAANFGGSKNDYDVIQPDGQGGVEVVDGTGTAYQNLFTTIAADFTGGSISSASYTSLSTMVDMKGLVDYMLEVFYRGDQDAPILIGSTTSPRNFYAVRDATTNGLFEFTTWDGELGLGDVNFNRTAIAGNLSPSTLFQDLKTNTDFAELVADETYRLFYNNGPLETSGSIQNPQNSYDADANLINVAIVGESARWGETQTSYPLTRDGDWVPEINNLNTNYFSDRSAIVLGQLKAITQFAMLGILPPSFSISGAANRGGTITPGSLLTLTDTNATTAGDVIYYTLDGTDPRLSGGGTSTSAHVYTSAFAINATETVTIRILNGTTWSPIDAATYSVNQAASASNLAITEVNYHPDSPSAAELAVNSSWTDSDFEFIELLNTSTSPIDLTGVAFTSGVTLTLGAYTLAAGQRAVVVSNPAAFAVRYGNTAYIVGTYTGHLSNSGATIELKSASKVDIANFTYADTWYPRTDGNGSSLEAISTTGNYNSSSNWRASYELNGTPGTAGNPVTDVVINEVVSAPAVGQQDSVELYNTTGQPINIGGWFLSDSANALTNYTFPVNTTISASGYLVVTAAAFDNTSTSTAFGINGTSGDSLYLTKPNSSGTPYAFADSDVFGTSAIGESFGRVVTSTGVYFYPQTSITLGAVNSGPRVGPVSITEFAYNTSAANANLQYVEIQNQTDAQLNVSSWQFSNGIVYTFPAGTYLAPYEAVTLLHFNPATDPTDLATFETTYGIDNSLRFLGPFTDKFSSKGEEVTLVRPDTPRPDEPGYTPLILVDDLTYGIASPWPVTGIGQALTRLSNHTFAEDPTNWTAAAPSIDTVAYGNAYFAGTTHYTYSTPTTLDSLNLTGTSAVTLGTGAGPILVAGGLNIASGTKLDTGTLDADFSGPTLQSVNSLVAKAYSNGNWTGLGITSSAAATDSTHLTSVGVIQNNQSGSPLYTASSTFGGVTPGVGDVLLKTTYTGDANLDGKVDGSDYSLIDAGYSSHGTLTGWFNGDFNYDGVIDGTDYALIDNAFNNQRSAFPSAKVAALTATPAAIVNEPSTTQKSKSAAVTPARFSAVPIPFTAFGAAGSSATPFAVMPLSTTLESGNDWFDQLTRGRAKQSTTPVTAHTN